VQVLASVLVLVAVSTGVVALIVTGVPVGWAAWQLLSRYQRAHSSMMGSGGGGGGGWPHGGWSSED
jgi:hypothetical protein